MATDSSQSNGRPVVDPVKQQVAQVYARALLGAAEETSQTASVVEELDNVVSQLLDAYPQIEPVLGSAIVSHEEKVGILDRLLGGRVSPIVLNFLKVLSQHGRLDCLRAVRDAADALYDEIMGRVRVRLSTAVPIDSRLTGELGNQLRTSLGGEPKLDCVVNPDLIGGIVLRIGDTVYDGSVQSELARIRTQMIDRSVHEIQSRRDRFRHPA